MRETSRSTLGDLCAWLIHFTILAVAVGLLSTCAAAPDEFDVIVRGGMVYDGTGVASVVADVGIVADKIQEIGDLSGASATLEIDASGLAVAPGFINMLSWAPESLLVDGRSLGDIRQGVTLEVFGEGSSLGPMNEEMKGVWRSQQRELDYEIDWTTLGEYLDSVERRGVATNVASFVGATTVRVHELGREDREPTQEELSRMQDLVRVAMEEGALGVGSSLIYAPAFYASTRELTELCRVAAEYGGTYISHIRSEGNGLLEAVEELLEIADAADIRAEIYHLKAAGRSNWPKLDDVIERIEEARAAGVDVAANMYTYTAGSTGLDAAMPPWVQEGGLDAWRERISDPEIRARVEREMRTDAEDWENLLYSAGADGVLLVGFGKDELRERYLGKSLAEVAALRQTSPEITAMDLVIEDETRVDAVYFLMSEENVARQIALPWVSFGSDAASMAPEEPFIRNSTHPRAYGNFARLLGRYVREQQVITLEEAIRKLTTLPASRLAIRDRGRLAPGFFADVVIFDPATVADHATFEEPHQLATGVRDVLVNGVPVLRDEQPTGKMPGRVVRGPGWTGWASEPASVAEEAAAG